MGAAFRKDLGRGRRNNVAGSIRQIYSGVNNFAQVGMTNQVGGGGTGTISSGSGVTFPLTPPIVDVSPGATINIDLSATTAHHIKMTLTENLTITLSNPPTTGSKIQTMLEFIQDSTGGWTVTFPGSVISPPTVDDTIDARSVYEIQTIDAGSTYDIYESLITFDSGAISAASVTLNNLGSTSINAHLIPQANKNLGSNGDPWSAIYGNEFTLPIGGTITSNRNMIISDVDGTIFNTPSGGDFTFGVNGSNTLNINANGIDMLSNSLSNARYGTDMDARNFNLTSTSTPTSGNQFRVVFDGHANSNTFISNNTVADTIHIESNGDTKMEISPTGVLIDDKLDMNGNEIDFGSGTTPTSGLIRLPNTSGIIKWESAPSTGFYGELSFDVDERFIWATPAGGSFGFWVGDLSKTLIASIDTTGLDMQFNTITDMGGNTINNLTTIPTLDGSNDLLFIRDATDGTIKKISASALASGGATSFIGFTGDADLDMNNLNIKSLATPTGGDQFRIIFDAHLDSDTYISNSTTVDRISIVSNTVSQLEISPTGLLLGNTVDHNNNPIETVSYIDFGGAHSTNGVIRLASAQSMEWEGVNDGDYHTIINSISDDLIFTTPSVGVHQFFIGDILKTQVAEFNSNGLDMQLNGVTNARNIQVDSSSTIAGFRDIGHTGNPSTPLAGEFYYNTTSNEYKFYNGDVWGNLGGAGGGASLALDNLASVAINTTLLPASDDSIDLGSITKQWRNLYVDGDAHIDFMVGSTIFTGSPTFTGALTTIASPSTVLGTSSSHNLAINARINSNIIPDANETYDLGSSSLRWDQLNIKTILGSSGIVRINADLNPSATDTFDLGSNSLRWDKIYIEDSQDLEEGYASGFAPTGQTNRAITFARPNGVKTQYRVKFQSGNSVLIAEEP